MTYALFPGLQDPLSPAPGTDRPVRALCRAVGMGLTDVEFNCCGYPVRHQSLEASLLSGCAQPGPGRPGRVCPS